MSVLATDSGAGSNANPIGGNWTTITGYNALKRLTNQIRGSVDAWDNNGARNTAVTWPDDQYSKLSVAALGTGDGGPAARIASAAKTFYICDRIDSSTLKLFRIVADAWTEIASVADTHVGGEIVECRCVGTTISAWRDGAQKASASDSSITSGSAGIYVYAPTMTFTNWEGGDFAAGATSLPPRRAFPRAVLGL